MWIARERWEEGRADDGDARAFDEGMAYGRRHVEHTMCGNRSTRFPMLPSATSVDIHDPELLLS